MQKNRIPFVLALAMVAALIAFFPPGPFSWRTFLYDPSTLAVKSFYLFKVYVVPALLSFFAVVCFRLQMGISMRGASWSSIFPFALVASGAMMVALRAMSGGVGGVPGYALGMAAGYTLTGRIYAIRKSGRTVFGRPMLEIVWNSGASSQANVASRPAPGQNTPAMQA